VGGVGATSITLPVLKSYIIVSVERTTKAKERLYRLVDQIPEGEVHTAERFLEYLAAAQDPVIRVQYPFS
jgi:hypothetical protein